MHSSTASHLTWSLRYSMRGHLSVSIKPLAENLRDAERLVELAARKKTGV
ncbi:hypothetical protein ACNKHR_00980 [Shigella flexneri]